MNNNNRHPFNFNVPIESALSFTSQPLQSGNSNAIDDAFFRQQLFRDLATIQQAHPELAPNQCRYILERTFRARMDALLKQSNMGSLGSQMLLPGDQLNPLPQETTGATLSSVPLTRTESCPLPPRQYAIEKSQMMRRQLSSVIPSSIPGTHDVGLSAQTVSQNYVGMKPYNFPDQAYTSVPNFFDVSTISSTSPMPPGSMFDSPTVFSSSIAGYLRQDFRDDPFSSVRGNACSKTFEQTINTHANAPPPDMLYYPHPDIRPQEGLFSPESAVQNIPYSIDFNNAAFAAPRMEPQASTSTFFDFDAASITLELECGDDLHSSGLPAKASTGEELHFDFGAIDMSASQLTVCANEPIPKALKNPSDKDLLSITSFSHSFSADPHILPELTHTVETPSSPAQMSRQHSITTNHTNNFGVIPRSSGNMEPLAAVEMDRQWSALSNPGLALPFQDNLGPSDGQTRKRVRQPPPEDINLLLKGAGVGTDISVDYHSYSIQAAAAVEEAYCNDGSLRAWQPMGSQIALPIASAQALDFVLETNLDGINPLKLRKLDGQDIHAARVHASQLRATFQDLSTSPTAFKGFIATTHPLPTFDQHFAMTRSETGPPLPAGVHPDTANAQQALSAITSSIETRIEPSRNPATNKITGSKQASDPAPIIINSGGSSQPPTRTYVRRAHPRVFCEQCTEVPDGFRGDHELRRHKERVHAVKKKVWVTKDISPNGDFFSGCKACLRGKHYFADYNAAAHLRRQHFVQEGKRVRSSKERSEKKKANVEKVKSKLEKWGIDWKEDCGGRGGWGGVGDEFTLRFLRRWMKQIETSKDSDYGSNDVLHMRQRKDMSDEEDGSDESDNMRSGSLSQNASTTEVLPTKDGLGGDIRGDKQKPQPPKQFIFTSGSLTSENGNQADRCRSLPQVPAPYNPIDIAPAAGFLETKRELQVLLEPTMDKIEHGLEAFFAVQNGSG